MQERLQIVREALLETEKAVWHAAEAAQIPEQDKKDELAAIRIEVELATGGFEYARRVHERASAVAQDEFNSFLEAGGSRDEIFPKDYRIPRLETKVTAAMIAEFEANRVNKSPISLPSTIGPKGTAQCVRLWRDYACQKKSIMHAWRCKLDVETDRLAKALKEYEEAKQAAEHAAARHSGILRKPALLPYPHPPLPYKLCHHTCDLPMINDNRERTAVCSKWSTLGNAQDDAGDLNDFSRVPATETLKQANAKVAAYVTAHASEQVLAQESTLAREVPAQPLTVVSKQATQQTAATAATQVPTMVVPSASKRVAQVTGAVVVSEAEQMFSLPKPTAAKKVTQALPSTAVETTAKKAVRIPVEINESEAEQLFGPPPKKLTRNERRAPERHEYAVRAIQSVAFTMAHKAAADIAEAAAQAVVEAAAHAAQAATEAVSQTKKPWSELAVAKAAAEAAALAVVQAASREAARWSCRQ